MISGHSHPPHGNLESGGEKSTLRRLAGVLALSLLFMVVEAVGGVLSGSLALLADAGHMLSDAMAVALSLAALWLAGRSVNTRHTYGYRRAEFLAAFVNAIGLMLLALWIVIEAVERFGEPRPIAGGLMLGVAVVGMGVNILALWLLHGRAGHNLNLRSAIWHVTGDLLGSLGAVGAALVIHFTGWTPIDPLLSLGIAILIGIAGGRILYDSASLLMDRVPTQIDQEEVSSFLGQWPEVRHICDLHIWSVSSNETMLTAHLVVDPAADRDKLLHRLLSALNARFDLAHLTLQLENEPHATCLHEW